MADTAKGKIRKTPTKGMALKAQRLIKWLAQCVMGETSTPLVTDKVLLKRKSADSRDMPPKRRQCTRKDLVSHDDYKDAEHYFEHGLRKIKPYFFEYMSIAKGRWRNRSLMDVFTTEFHDRNSTYYKYAIEKGLITINGEHVSPQTKIKDHDLIGHKIHRHEPPCTDKDIKIIHEDDSVYVIDKPGGIPIHPAGRYRHNSVVHILRQKLNVPPLHPVNRLDRVTSGVVIIAKNPEIANAFKQAMTNKEISKEYVCRVQGEFPEHEIVCDAPIKTVSYKLSLNYVHNDGKPCTTIFNRLSYDGTTSVVRCRPVTGRTHQIRVHLRYLGHPIPNDPLYSNATHWSSMLRPKQTMTDDDSKLLVDKVTKEAVFESGEWDNSAADGVKTDITANVPTDAKADETAHVATDAAAGSSTTDTTVDSPSSQHQNELQKCPQCSISLMEDPRPEDLFIWLHAWRYAGDGWSYKTDLPDWANEIPK